MTRRPNAILPKSTVFLLLLLPFLIQSFYTFSFGKSNQLRRINNRVGARETDVELPPYEAYLKQRKEMESGVELSPYEAYLKQRKQIEDEKRIQEESKAVPKEVSMEVFNEISKEISDSRSETIPNKILDEITETKPEIVTREISEEISEPKAEANLEVVAQEISEPKTEAKPEAVSQEISEEIPEPKTEAKPEVVAREISEKISEPKVEAKPETISEAFSDKVSIENSGKVPETVSEDVSDKITDQSQTNKLETTLNQASDETLVKVPETVSDEVPKQRLIEVTEEIAKFQQASDEVLTESVQIEISKMKLRSSGMSSLTSTLKKSITKKKEFENFIARELETLSNLLTKEAETEREREAALIQLLAMFDKGIKDKTEKIVEEKALFTQMLGIKKQVKEETIRLQIDSAIKKKEQLIAIEEVLKKDILECRANLAQELSSTGKRAEKIEDIVAVLPDPKDLNRTRAYDWDDLQNLQNLLLENVTSLNKSNKRVEELIAEFEIAMNKKRNVLNEEPIRLKKGANQGLVVSKSEDMSVEELAEIAGMSGIEAVNSLGKSLNIGAQSVNEYLKGNKVKSGQESLRELVQSTGSYLKSIQKSLEAAAAAYGDARIKENEITSFDKMIERTLLGLKAIQESQEVSKSLNQSSELGKKISDSAVQIRELAAETLVEVGENKALAEALSETLMSMQRSFAALTKIGSKYILSSTRPERMLGPAPEAEEGRTDRKREER